MTCNYKNQMKELSVCFRKQNKNGEVMAFAVYQNRIFETSRKTNDLVYLDFENDEQLEKLIRTLESLRDKKDENTDEVPSN